MFVHLGLPILLPTYLSIYLSMYVPIHLSVDETSVVYSLFCLKIDSQPAPTIQASCRLKSLPKSFNILQNDPNSLPKMIKIQVRRESGAALWRTFAPRRLSAASWTPLGQLLGGSWRILGASWVAPGPSWTPSWGVLERLGGTLEASCGKFNAKMEPSWH